jgi:hypothetical protein
MDKEFKLDIRKWLETASDEELDAAKAKAQLVFGRLSDPALRGDAAKIVTEIDKEIYARLEAGFKRP